MKSGPIAIVGMACRYPDANSPAELWNNVLAQRRAFRRIPPERLSLDDYWSSDPNAADCTYVKEGAFLADYQFDRFRFRVSGDAWRSSDMAHWLALDVAADAFADAGFLNAEGLPRSTTAVFLGNTLTGETSRAQLMRQRWPFVRRVLAATLISDGWAEERIAPLLETFEASYKEPFPEPGPESLVGGLANTIAGRICNFFDLQGGGYVVDGACASSLLAIAQACSALAAGDVDAALAGGVDISIDPFELIGFARVGALASEQMRVYDKRSAGFLPGEGCGLLLLMREAEAIATGRRIYALLRGWGISSDGAGSMTRPEVNGQTLALQRAYRRAGIDVSDVGYFEGHGTGTAVGDSTELETIAALRRRRATDQATFIGSIKANIGHTKAAAGAAGLIKATMALHSRVLPPTTGCEEPREELQGEQAALRILSNPLPWESAQSRFAGVSAMGFGGINTHIVLEEARPARRAGSKQELRVFAASPQDAELFVFGAEDEAALIARLSAFIEIARDLSFAEMTDAAAALPGLVVGAIPAARAMRAAVVASTPSQLLNKLLTLRELIQSGVAQKIQPSNGIYLSSASRAPRIGLLFPGHAAPVRRTAGALGRRFAASERLYADGSIPDGLGTSTGIRPDIDTSFVQPAVVRASLSALAALEALGITGAVAIGHSLGEIAALTWAGALDWDAAVRLASLRGRTMMSHSCVGAMASIAAPWENVESILANGVVIAAVNGPRQTVVSGDSQAISAISAAARARGWHVSTLPVAHAFHSPAMAEVARALAPGLEAERFRLLERPVYSTVTGASIPGDANLAELLTRQITARVEFEKAINAAACEADLFVEAGPGATLAGLTAQCVDTPTVSLDAGSESYRGLLSVVAAAFALGAPVRLAPLFEGRFTKPFAMIRPKFLANPCESAPIIRTAITNNRKPQHAPEPAASPTPASPFETVRNLIAQHVELPPSAVTRDHRLLSDLHLNSIAVAQIVAQAARALGTSAPLSLADLANARVATLADALVRSRQPAQQNRALLPGLGSWVRCFAMHWVEEERPVHSRMPAGDSNWRVVAPDDSPLKAALLQAFSKPGSGVVVHVPAGATSDSQANLLLEAARQSRIEGDHFVLIHHGDSSSAFARSLRMERPEIDVCVARIPVSAAACEEAYLEALSARGFEELWYDATGRRRVPRLQHVAIPNSSRPYLTEADVLLVSGGGKGIGAGCALALARSSSASLIILGRSNPETDHELALNLNRMSAAGIRSHYVRADICDRSALTDALRQGERAFGKVTAILHAAGHNSPALIDSLNGEAIAATLGPKVDGLRNLLDAISAESLRLLVSFGSIIGRMGLAGNADYAFANERLRQITEDYGARHPHCRCLTLEWSLWSGAGMAERLGAVESLARQGITPISPEQGTAILTSILAQKELPPSLIVTSRFQALPELRFDHAEPPLLRFLERTRLFVPGVELIADAKVSHSSDPYLNDHVFERTPLLPAVIGMEALAQAAMAVSGETGALAANGETGAMIWRDIAFEYPVVVPSGESANIRIYAVAEPGGTVRVAIRAEQDGFEADHFRARIAFEAPPALPPIPNLPHNAPARIDLYGTVLFQSGRFQRLLGYSHLTATSCRAKLQGAAQDAERWFGFYYSPVLLLGDPGLRDAAIHSIQGCIPDRTLIPQRVDEIRMFSTLNGAEVTVQAVERSSCCATFVYDLDLLDRSGRMLEQWRGLTLRALPSKAAVSVATVAQ